MNRASSRGFTLVESLIAVLVLSIGSLGLFGLLTVTFRAARTRDFQTAAVASFAELAAQIRAARCDLDPAAADVLAPNLLDPGLFAYLDAGWVEAYDGAPGNTIDHLGAIASVPPMRIAYRVDRTPNLGSAKAALDVRVRVRMITHDPAIDSTDSMWTTEFILKKACSVRPRSSLQDPRGAFL